MGIKHIGVMTLTFQGHVTSSVTWPLDSGWVISYWWSFGPKSLYLTVSEIFSPKHHVLIDTMLNRHCACAYHVICTPYVKFKYIFQFLTPTLPIQYVTFIELRWRIRGVLSLTLTCYQQKCKLAWLLLAHPVDWSARLNSSLLSWFSCSADDDSFVYLLRNLSSWPKSASECKSGLHIQHYNAAKRETLSLGSLDADR